MDEALAERQNYLVEVLTFIEGLEGLSLYPKKRKRVPRGEQWIAWSQREGRSDLQ